MTATRCYLDYNATAPIRASARASTAAALDLVGNPSSVHTEGRDARSAVSKARREIADAVGAGSEAVVLTSGGTESAHLLLTPDLRRSGRPRTERILILSIEHACVLRGHGFSKDAVTLIPVDVNGVIDLPEFEELLSADGGRPALVAVQAANNETGVVQPVRTVADLTHAHGGVLVCDAVQAVGRMPFALAASGADAIFLSGHKLGAPKGSGAAVLAPDVVIDAPFLRGGGQERGLRSGTENVPGIVGFGSAAIEAAVDAAEFGRLADLQASLEAGLRATRDDVVIMGAAAARLPNTTCFAVPGFGAETLLMAFDLEGVALSSGSACSSGKVTRSHVLEAMHVPTHLSRGALRVSLGWSSTMDQVERFLQAFAVIMHRLQRRSVPVAA